MPKADLIILNGHIVTMDALRPRVTALAAGEGRIVALGDDAEIKRLASDSTRIIDAGGRLVLPGFQDTHIHLQDSGFEHSRGADLENARTIAELQEMLRAESKRHNSAWVSGTG